MLTICILISCALIVLAHYSYKDYCPVKVFTYYWTVQIILLTIGGYGYLYFSYKGILFICLCLIAMNIGAIICSPIRYDAVGDNRKYKIEFDERKMMLALGCCFILGFFQPLKIIISNGFSISSIFNFQMLLEMNNNISVSRYSDDSAVSGGMFTQIMSVFSYLCPLLGGFMSPLCKKRLLCFFSMFPLLFGGLTQGVKMGIITAVLLFLSGYIVCCFMLGKRVTVKLRTLLYAVLGFLLLIGVLLVSMMFRIGKFDVDTLSVVLQKFVSYAFGHLPAFDNWASSQNIMPDNLTFGGKLFFGITNFLGLMHREQGLYEEFSVISAGGDETNVYTLFRILVDDFGFIGSLMFFVLLGIVSQVFYRKIQSLVDYRFSATFLVAVYFLIFWSFATSVFVYTSYIVPFLLFYFFISKTTNKVLNVYNT